MNPLVKLGEYGQALWLDDIHRALITSGELKRLIAEDGLRGLTSNPAIFNKAIAESKDYREDIDELREEGPSPSGICEALMIKDVQMAADIFRPLYDRTHGEHGYVSLEVNPHLARATGATIEEARRLWREVGRPNLFIKVPGTAEGLPAIEQLIGEGINVNVTLLFSLQRYREVAVAYLSGIENRLAHDEPVGRVRSVASFFLSRIDALLDPQLDSILNEGGNRGRLAGKLRGEVAIASAKLAYEIYCSVMASDYWDRLAVFGARPQWLLWASTSTKDRRYSDLKYVEPLIGPETITTLPAKTLAAYRDHGRPQARLEEGTDHAREVLNRLSAVGISLGQATAQLEDEGINQFIKPYDELLQTLQRPAAMAR